MDLPAIIAALDAVKIGRRNANADQTRIDRVYALVNELRTLVQDLGAAIDEEEAGEDEAPAEGKAIGAREDVNPKAGVSQYGDVRFADQKNKKYPIDTEDHVRAAWNYINKPANAGKYDPDEVATIKRNIVSAWKKLIDKAGPPSAETKTSLDDAEMVYGSEIKALDGDRIGGYGVLFGTAETHDASPARDYFDKNTDYWLKHFGWPRPMTYHHGMHDLKELRDEPVVGSWTKATVDEVGVFFEGELNRAHKYYGAVKELVRRGYLKLSSDSAPQWVIRERQPNGANYVKRWPVISVSPTVTPAEPRLAGVSFKALLAELGLNDIPDDPEATDADAARSDETKAADDERARRLSLELRLIELETIA